MEGKFYVDRNDSLRTITWKDDDDYAKTKVCILPISCGNTFNRKLNFLQSEKWGKDGNPDKNCMPKKAARNLSLAQKVLLIKKDII
jgi:hypothetical protein